MWQDMQRIKRHRQKNLNMKKSDFWFRLITVKKKKCQGHFQPQMCYSLWCYMPWIYAGEDLKIFSLKNINSCLGSLDDATIFRRNPVNIWWKIDFWFYLIAKKVPGAFSTANVLLALMLHALNLHWERLHNSQCQKSTSLYLPWLLGWHNIM
jgi:hypothetical protein